MIFNMRFMNSVAPIIFAPNTFSDLVEQVQISHMQHVAAYEIIHSRTKVNFVAFGVRHVGSDSLAHV